MTVLLAATARNVSLAVTDDGVGFDAAQSQKGAPTYGIVTMRERAESVGASLRVESAPGAGTRVEVEMARAPS